MVIIIHGLAMVLVMVHRLSDMIRTISEGWWYLGWSWWSWPCDYETIDMTYKRTFQQVEYYYSNFYFLSMLSRSGQPSDSNRHKKISLPHQHDKIHHAYIHSLEPQDPNKISLKYIIRQQPVNLASTIIQKPRGHAADNLIKYKKKQIAKNKVILQFKIE